MKKIFGKFFYYIDMRIPVRILFISLVSLVYHCSKEYFLFPQEFLFFNQEIKTPKGTQKS